MKTVEVEKPGGFETLKVKEEPDPVPGEGEVLIAVRAAGINFADVMTRMGIYPEARKHGYPIVPGFDTAGEIVAVGKGVTNLEQGDRVVASNLFGGYTSHRLVPAKMAWKIPDELSFEEAAAIPVAFLTAFYALDERARVREGETLLVQSAAGGLGSAAVQIGKLLGMRVIAAVGSSEKVPYVKELGADEVIDGAHQELWSEVKRLAPDGLDVVIDNSSGEPAKKAFKHLAIGGRLVMLGTTSLMVRGQGTSGMLGIGFKAMRIPRFTPFNLIRRNATTIGVLLPVREKPQLMASLFERLVAWIQEGKFSVGKITAYPMERVAEAHEALQSGKTMGKLVLLP